MNTYFVAKVDAKSNGCCWEEARSREAHPKTCTMTARGWRSGYLDQGHTGHPYDDSGYTRVHHPSDGWTEVPRYDAMSHHIRKNGDGYSDC